MPDHREPYEPPSIRELGTVAELTHHGRDTPLRCVVFPIPDREAVTVGLRPLGGAEALIAVTRNPRILGWADPAIIRRQFALTAELVNLVPMFEMRVPWGPPFPAAPHRLTERLR